MPLACRGWRVGTLLTILPGGPTTRNHWLRVSTALGENLPPPGCEYRQRSHRSFTFLNFPQSLHMHTAASQPWLSQDGENASEVYFLLFGKTAFSKLSSMNMH